MKKTIICSLEVVLVLLYISGLVSLLLLGLWVISGLTFALGEDPTLPVIAFVPKWIFLFSFFSFLGKTKPVKRYLEWIDAHF